MKDIVKVGVAGAGALGSIVIRALLDGIAGYELTGIADIKEPNFNIPHYGFEKLVEINDLIIECLPPKEVPALAKLALEQHKELILISSSALLLFPDILKWKELSKGRIIVPSGALAGLDAVTALSYPGIDSAKIASTKPPQGFQGAPYIAQNNIELSDIHEKKLIFSGNAIEAARAFPANVNVAATLSLAGLGPHKTMVEVWADPHIKGNCHEIIVSGQGSTITSRVENTPDPTNPKSSMLAGYSIISILKRQSEGIAIG